MRYELQVRTERERIAQAEWRTDCHYYDRADAITAARAMNYSHRPSVFRAMDVATGDVIDYSDYYRTRTG